MHEVGGGGGADIVHVHCTVEAAYLYQICTVSTYSWGYKISAYSCSYTVSAYSWGYTVGWVNLYQKVEIEKYTVCGKLIFPKK